jgi:hypothetical protein
VTDEKVEIPKPVITKTLAQVMSEKKEKECWALSACRTFLFCVCRHAGA